MPQTQRSKEDADRLVESLKRKGNSGRELQLKGFHIASLYSQAKEYALALPYCQNYISLKPNDARAHKLLGQIYEARNNIPRAIDGYRRALELNDTQKDLILKVADLYCQVRCEPERHRYWAEKAEKYFPGHEIVHKTREHIFRADGKLSELEQYLRAKLRTYPSDPKLHVQLLLVLVELGRLNEAKQLCVKVESSHLFDNDQRWWEQAINVYLTMLRSWGREQSHHGQVACITTYCSLLYAINRLVLLSLANPTMPTAQTAEMLKRLDHDLVKASDCVASSQYSVEVPYGQITLDEMKAQMYYHVGTLLMKMAANNQVRWNDVMGMATVSYLVSLQVVPDPGHANSKNEGLANLYRMGCSRLSEICHVLHGLVKQHSADWLEECVEQWCNEEGRQQFLYQVFGDDSGVTELSSLHVDDSFLLTNTPELPDLVDSVFQFDQVSIMYEPSNLHRLVWLGLQWDIRQDGILPDIGSFIEGVFDRLVFSTKNLDNISVDNIRHLDIEAFLYASVHIAGVQLARLNERDLISKDLPKQRPLVLHRGLCSEEQLEWYTALYQLYSAKAKSSERGKLRMMAQKGLEILRCRINHGLETGVLVQLGKTFHARMTEVQSQSEDPRDKQDQWQAYQRMSVLYWQSALEHLKLLASGKAVPQHKKPFFPYMKQTLESAQIQQHLDEGSVVVSEFKFQQGKHTEALTYLDKAKTPNALYTKAVMYKTLAGLQTDGRSEDELNTSQVSKHGELLDKAKYALFATMDSIEDKPNHSLHTPVQEMLVEVESDQTCMAGQLSMMDSTAYDTSRISGIAADVSNRSFGVKSEYDAEEVQVLKEPSPRRLAAELRAMNSSHTRVLEENASLRELQSSHGKILEQNQSLMEKQNDLMESNNTLMKQIVEMNMKFQELSTQMAQKQMETPPATPAPPPPASTQAATITSNTPLIISTQLCRIETKNVAGGLHPSLVASPATLHGMYQPAYAAPPPGAYYDQNHGYGYGYPDPTHMMAASTPTGHHSLVQSPYQGFEETEMVPGLSLGHNINQGIPQSSMAQHPGFAASPIGLLGNQAQQMPGQHPQTNTMLINDPNTAARMPVPDVASRAAAGGAAYFSSDQSPAAMSPARPVSAAERGITDVSPPPLGAPTGNKTESPLLMSMLTEGRKGKGQPGVSGGIVAGSSPQSGSPVRPQAATFSFVPSDTASISQSASQPQSFVFGKPQTPSGSFSLGSQQTKPTEGQQSSAISEFSFRAQSTPTSATTVTTASPQSKSTPVTTAAQSPFAGFSFSGGSAQKAATPTVFGQPASTVASSTSMFSQQPVFSPSPATASKPSTSVFGQPDSSASSSKTSIFGQQPVLGQSSFVFGQPASSASSSTTSTFGQPASASSSSSSIFGQQSGFGQSPSFGAGLKVSAFDQQPISGQSSATDVSSTTSLGQKSASVFGQPSKPVTPSFTKPTPAKPSEDEDVMIVSVKMPSAALQEKAKRLQLPLTFYNYEDAPPCPGCVGCDPDDLDKNRLACEQRRAEADSAKKSASNQFGASSAASKEVASQGPSGGMFGSGSKGMSFEALATDTGNGFANKDASGQFAFANAGAQLFTHGGGDGPDADGHDGQNQEYDPQYEAIVTLPDAVDLKTGHEEEECLYKQRCRLYRFDAEKNQWKERGVGDVKLMKHKDTGRVRVVMRREQVHKVCANHTITTAMQLKVMEMSDRAWVYNAIDFSEGEASPELLAIKFKTPDIAHDYKTKFEECQTEMAQLPVLPQQQEETVPKEKPKDTSSEDLKAKFAMKTGEWECDACYTRNPADKTACLACQTPKPGAAAPSAAPAMTGGFKFGAPQTGPSESKASVNLMAKFAAQPGQWECDICCVRNLADKTACVSCSTPKPGVTQPPPAPSATSGGFKFGNTQQSSSAPAAQTTGGFKPGAGGFPSFTFGTQSTSNTSTGQVGIKIAGTQNLGFTFGTSPSSSATTPVKQQQAAPNAERVELNTTPGGTPTTRFSFDAGDSRNTVLPQFSFGNADKDPQSTNTGFMFGGVSSVPSTPERVGSVQDLTQASPPQYPFTKALQSFGAAASTPDASTSFSDMAKSTGTAFSFRMDIGSDFSPKPSPPKPKKSPGFITPAKSPGGKDGEYYQSEEGDDIHFEPIVQLPDQVELKTGEEGEDVVFSHRSKLYRFDTETNQWKERGIGDIKLLHNPTSNRYRIVMRRDQVFRVCANHYLNENMKLTPNAGSDRSWVWQAMDASDGDPMPEQLAVKFKSPDTAVKFKDIFEAAVEDLKKNGTTVAAATDSSKSDVTTTPEISDAQSSEPSDDFMAKFAIKPGQWECDACYTRNPPDCAACLACQTPKPVDVQSSEISSSSSEPKEVDKPAKTPNPPMRKVESAFSEIFKNSPLPPPKPISAVTDKELNPEDERDIHFDPIANLPDKVDLQTGEENETSLFCSRSKLYRFDGETTKAWKDRGVGDVKILCNEATGRFRVIMRREQVLKVCANHYITTEMKLTPNAGSKTSWVWLAMDASEGEPKFEQLAIKFKLEDTARKFKQVFEECQAKLGAEADDDDEESKLENSISETQEAAISSVPPTAPDNKPATPEPPIIASSQSPVSSSSLAPNKTSTIQGSPMASPSDATEEGAVGSALGLSPDVIPKSTESPASSNMAPKESVLGSLLSGAGQTAINPVGGDREDSDTTASGASGASSSVHSTSDNEEEEQEVGVSNV